MHNKFKAFLYPSITAVCLLIIWIVSIKVFEIPDYLIPTPWAVLENLDKGYIQGLYWPHFFYTFKNTVVGYVIGSAVALVLGAMVAESKTFERFFFPYIVALQATPKVAIAPLILVWFGFGMASKVVLIALMTFFPVFINTISGVRQTNPAMLDLMRVCSASRVHVFWHVKLPSAAGHIFAGLQISVVLSLIGAVVAEFVSSSMGLGYLIQAASVNMDVATMFACLFSLIAIGLSGTRLMSFLHHKFVFWDRSSQTIGSE
ncbi:ABC transporter permease [Alcaligenes endophyticus]|uniref:ABC transporter permease n=1 Tax=Alcaligenes endophyticus TaxID=1929088 RepID=A0ABT8EKX8_9BURK|nr:ABC transporter permease [Alcaligenes endophyticus]MCX5590688.1 ABC transporter permease [Alcaligenes endophyticus]MDN4121948.1 ABC transporter permease [Alcaligenes endophyticus]